MITLAAIETALGQALDAIPEVDRVAWPNRVTDPARPFVMFQHVPGAWSDRTVTGGSTVASGFVTVTIVTKAGEFSGAANALADAIMGAFPKGRRITVGAYCLLIPSPPRPLPGILDGADWRQPVQIDYQTETA